MTYEELVDDLVVRNGGVQATKMMGMPSLKANGKLFAGQTGEDMVFKLGGDDHARRSRSRARTSSSRWRAGR